jgi:hypothetical protein
VSSNLPQLFKVTAVMTLPDPLSYPLRAEHEEWAIEWLARAATHVRDMLEDHGPGRFETLLKEVLREGVELKVIVQVVEAADKGDWLCDKALRDIGAELQTALIQKRDLEPGHLQIISYYQRAAERAPVTRKPGRYDEYGSWFRNVAICMLITQACKWLGVPPTRNRESRRAGRRPSGCSLTSAALKRHGIRIRKRPSRKTSGSDPGGHCCGTSPGRSGIPSSAKGRRGQSWFRSEVAWINTPS